MAFVTPFGNHQAGDSLMHRLDTRVKLLLLTCLLTGLFLFTSWLGIAIFAVLMLMAYLNARIPLAMALRGLTPLIAILAFTLLANSLGFSAAGPEAPRLVPEWMTAAGETGDGSVSGDETGDGSVSSFSSSLENEVTEPSPVSFIPLIGGLGFKPSGFLRGLFLALRIIMLFSATVLVTYTSSMVALSDALVALLRPLAALRVPTEDVAMVFSIALRFIQLTADEAEALMVAQQARGAAFDRGGLIRRAKAWLPVLLPLFVKLFRRADRLAAAMETRCYQGQGRTRLRQSRLRPQSLATGLLAAGALIAIGVLF